MRANCFNQTCSSNGPPFDETSRAPTIKPWLDDKGVLSTWLTILKGMTRIAMMVTEVGNTKNWFYSLRISLNNDTKDI